MRDAFLQVAAVVGGGTAGLVIRGLYEMYLGNPFWGEKNGSDGISRSPSRPSGIRDTSQATVGLAR